MGKRQATTAETVPAKPFMKWAGGKTQLLPLILNSLPCELTSGDINRYVEPFVGGGALFFEIADFYPSMELVISDINEELILTYTSVQRDAEALIALLSAMEEVYLGLEQEERDVFFYGVRSMFNDEKPYFPAGGSYDMSWVHRAAQVIFLNRTCFNGLFRVNSRGLFNVPCGRYASPQICNPANLRAVAAVLERATIRLGDFESIEPSVDAKTFVYFDPPYRPVNTTSNFTSYASGAFGDAEQLRLAALYRRLSRKGARLMLSNSDPWNESPEDVFFDDAYSEFRIERVSATRRINSKADSRGLISELIITNY